ncbi:flagellar biosynthetic protein FliO [Lutispora thermophila]|mgnify:CR=1 FL=1|uniref:Flagellar biosynthesis protein, FliO n=1 Tax=Lutispora thermophila DSM 19022 TaxID=1122184 RepID=A0A1M6G7J7_9FIRM|nr:flagellar biosynthetic protein FliO [Lutispora thermophila]SHJ05913.1 Flagellar biosynthesis protein, FliO [Lutispora thermophila DSM 19022]
MNGLYESNGFMSLLKLIYIIIIFLIVLAFSYYFSKFIGRRVTGKNKHMKLIETLSFGNDRRLHIIKVCDEFYLISDSLKGIYLIDKLTDEKMKDQLMNSDGFNDFDSYLINTYSNMDLHHSTNGIKHNIEKLKKIIKGIKKNE